VFPTHHPERSEGSLIKFSCRSFVVLLLRMSSRSIGKKLPDYSYKYSIFFRKNNTSEKVEFGGFITVPAAELPEKIFYF